MHFFLYLLYTSTLLHVSARLGHLQGVFTVKDQELKQYVALYKIVCQSRLIKF